MIHSTLISHKGLANYNEIASEPTKIFLKVCITQDKYILF